MTNEIKSKFLIIAEEILAFERRPMTADELVKIANERGMFSDKWVGKTPRKTMDEKLSRHIRKLGEQSIFVRVESGQFYLRRLLDQQMPVYEARPLRRTPPTEKVLVFPSRWLDQHSRFQGISRSWQQLSSDLFANPICDYIDRIQAEQDESYKQILTYILVTRGTQILAFTRGTFNRVENYLRGSRCVGFGGHVSISDFDVFDHQHMGLLMCAGRELREELKLPPKDFERIEWGEGFSIIGVLNDDSSSTGRKHFAFILQYETSDDSGWDRPRAGEKSITQLQWLDMKSPRFSLWDFEYWSQLCLREYFSSNLERVQPRFRIQRVASLRPPHILCIVGEVGSGKSEATRILKEEFGYTVANVGKVIAKLLSLPPVPETPREIFSNHAQKFIESQGGPIQLAMEICRYIETQYSRKVLVDGIRHIATLKAIKEIANHRVGVIFVHTPPDIAFQFYKDREGEESTLRDFLKLREHPVEGKVRDMIGQSDAVLYNWSNKVLYHGTIREFMQAVKKCSGR